MLPFFFLFKITLLRDDIPDLLKTFLVRWSAGLTKVISEGQVVSAAFYSGLLNLLSLLMMVVNLGITLAVLPSMLNQKKKKKNPNAHVSVSIDYIVWSILSLGLPLWPEHMLCLPPARKKLFTILWVFITPIWGFFEFFWVQLPRFAAISPDLAASIFKLCTADSRRLENCIDFYSGPVPNVPWWLIWLLWVVFWATSLPYFVIWVRETMWKRISVAGKWADGCRCKFFYLWLN